MCTFNSIYSDSSCLDVNIPEKRDTPSLYKTAIQGNLIARDILMEIEHFRTLYRGIVESDASLIDQVPNSITSSNPIVCITNGTPWSALDCAVEMGNEYILDSLLRRKASPNVTYNECYPIHRAAKKGSPTMVRSLLQHKADATRLDSGRKSPAVQAVEEWHVETAEILLKAAPINAKNNKESFQILEAAIRANSPPQMLDLLLRSGATPTNNSCYPPVSLLPKCMLRSQFECLLNADAVQNMLPELKTEEDQRTFVDQLNQFVKSKHPYWTKCLNAELMDVGLMSADAAADDEVASITASELSAPPKINYERHIVREDVVDRCSFPANYNELKRLVYINSQNPDGHCLGMNLDLITRFLLLNQKTQLVENLSRVFKFDNRAKEIQAYSEKLEKKLPNYFTSKEETWREVGLLADLHLYRDLELVAGTVIEIKNPDRIFKGPPLCLKDLIQKHQNRLYDISIKTKTPHNNHAISLFQGEGNDCIFDPNMGLFIVDKKATAKLLWHIISIYYKKEEFVVQFAPLNLST